MRRALTSATAVDIVHSDAASVLNQINEFTCSTFRTRGGRLGSGMGSLLEALWVYYTNRTLQNEGGLARDCELAWLPDHEPADFACLRRGVEWNPEGREGELFRIEAKSMNIGVDEAKGHFTNLEKETSYSDQILVLVWSWTPLENYYVWPRIHDYFLGHSIPIIRLRDALHIARGGTFVEANHCPDKCAPARCTHVGEPLNAAGKRERRTGPVSSKPANVEYAANFGGLVRMLKTNNDKARGVFRKIRKESDDAHRYISFIHTHYPDEEISQYKKAEWMQAAEALGIKIETDSVDALAAKIRDSREGYRERLRDLA